MVLALALAFAAVGFGHRDLGKRALDLAYLAFVATGVTAEDLCADHTGHDPVPGHSDHGAASGCEVCRLVDTGLPAMVANSPEPWHASRRFVPLCAASESLRTATAYRLAQVRKTPPACRGFVVWDSAGTNLWEWMGRTGQID